MNKKSLKPIAVSLLVMALWGSLFPMVKIGYTAFSIDTSCFPNLILFAGIRFTVSGIITLCICKWQRTPLMLRNKKNILSVVLVGLFGVVLHYGFTYSGLALTDSAKTALLKQLGILVFICFSFLFFKDDRFSRYKCLSAFLGLCGIVCLDMNSLKFSFGIGETMVICASFCTVISNIFFKKNTAIPALSLTAGSQLFGGVLLLITGIGTGGKIGEFNLLSFCVLMYICAATVVSYGLWYSTVRQCNLSKLFIIKFAEPLFAGIFGFLLLKENIFTWQYLAAIIFVGLAVYCSSLKTPTAMEANSTVTVTARLPDNSQKSSAVKK